MKGFTLVQNYKSKKLERFHKLAQMFYWPYKNMIQKGETAHMSPSASLNHEGQYIKSSSPTPNKLRGLFVILILPIGESHLSVCSPCNGHYAQYREYKAKTQALSSGVKRPFCPSCQPSGFLPNQLPLFLQYSACHLFPEDLSNAFLLGTGIASYS